MSTANKTGGIRIRFTPADIQIVKGLARLESVTVSEWFRRRMVEGVERAGGIARVPVVEVEKRERVVPVSERVGSAMRSTGIEVAAGNDEPWLDKEPDWGA